MTNLTSPEMEAIISGGIEFDAAIDLNNGLDFEDIEALSDGMYEFCAYHEGHNTWYLWENEPEID